MRNFILLMILFTFASCRQNDSNRTINFPKSIEIVKEIPEKENVWVFILAGQSNMAGRGFVEPADTVSDKRIFSISGGGD